MKLQVLVVVVGLLVGAGVSGFVADAQQYVPKRDVVFADCPEC